MRLLLASRSLFAPTLLSLRTLRALTRHTLRIAQWRGERITLSVVFLGRRQMQSVSRRYRRKRTATDVLSFRYVSKKSSRQQKRIEGEILLCPPVIRERAKRERETTLNVAEWLYVHAVLHLLGIHHQRPSARRRMEALERRILKNAQT